MAAFWKKVPFLRLSFLRMGFNAKHLFKEWQVGDGREERLAQHVVANARKGDPNDAIRVIDAFCYDQSFMMNVGDEKGALLDAAVKRAAPKRILELGTYCGYSALRLAVTAPSAHVWSIEFNPANAEIARRIHAHAGVADRITVVVGTLGDGGKTLRALREQHGFASRSVDFVFVDHAKDAYLPDLKRILDAGWLKPGAIVVADNIKFPGAPDYLAYMRENEGRGWRTQEHSTHVEYQSLLPDIVLESEYSPAA